MGLTSIIMVSYHTGPVLRHAIAQALAQEGLAELIVVDNGNPPATTALLREYENNPHFRRVHGQGNVGFARGCNLGAAQATGDYLLLLNPDCLLPAATLAALRDALEALPQAMLVAPLLIKPNGAWQKSCRRNLLSMRTAIGQGLRLPGLPRLNISTPPPAAPECVPAVSGACMFLRRADYERLGGMDEAYFLHVEDLEFCRRIARAGGKIYCLPQWRVTHWKSTSDITPCHIERHKRNGFLHYFQQSGVAAMLLRAGIRARYGLRLLSHLLRPPRVDVSGRRLLAFLDAKAAAPVEGLKDMPVLVTGASAQIGACALGRLAASGARIIALSREDQSLPSMPEVQWCVADLHALPPIACEAVLHCAPLIALPQALPSFTHAKRIVAFSSTSLFARAHSPSPADRQVAAKLAEAEEACKAYCAKRGIALTLLRPTLVYGLGIDKNVARMERFMRRWRVLPFVPPGKGLRQPVHADDLALAAVRALVTPQAENKAYNVSGGESLTWRAMAQRVAEKTGRRILFLPLPFLPAALDLAGKILHNPNINGGMAHRMNHDHAFSHEDAARDLAYAPRKFTP